MNESKYVIPATGKIGGPITGLYKNYRGEIRERTIIPTAIYYGSTPWHLDDQWLLCATDIESGDHKVFALRDFAFLEPKQSPGIATFLILSLIAVYIVIGFTYFVLVVIPGATR